MPSSACDWSSDVCSSDRSEEHTSELQSRSDLVCRLLLEKKKNEYHPNGPFMIRNANHGHTCTPTFSTRNYSSPAAYPSTERSPPHNRDRSAALAVVVDCPR